jgi:GNAT superfamily N-acetyltransferase
MNYHSNMAIRAADPSDAQQIVALVNLAFRVEGFFVYGDRTSLDQCKAMFHTGTFLLAETAGQLAGCLYFELRGERAYLGLLSVDPSQQRQGVGRALVSDAERRAGEAGCEFMDMLTVNLRTELLPIYERMGYRQSGTAPFPAGVPTKIPCHFLRMSKTLR